MENLTESRAPTDPYALFADWFAAAPAADPHDPAAIVLTTIDPDGWPEARAVLLRGFDARGFVFYTNYRSAKARALAANPRAALCWLCKPSERQVRVVGSVERVTAAESDAYFAQRHRLSQLGAWASRQSEVIADRGELEARVQAVEQRFDGLEVQRPEHWGGFRVHPRSIEFWQGRPGRLHDRLRYHADADGWRIERLAP